MATITAGVEAKRSQGNLVWKFGYGSNMPQENLRQKKGLDPQGAKPLAVLREFWDEQ
ncbi:MAG: hypothetical protein HOI23_17070 [Deltaproteobacteria bacterium]|jgi:hypothetical protein|nr:hypothetical protein [Deltaproteobacteria bacterium]MBT6435011.1 hypothetical protein [Deltaproteobacteria bacterium]MBT6491791.1 hypothetical protein [Deltaproteobacteria bacterium]